MVVVVVIVIKMVGIVAVVVVVIVYSQNVVENNGVNIFSMGGKG